jgi:tetratricopeptide (TPR) repeat protein
LELDRSLANSHGQIGVAKVQLGHAEDTEAHVQAALRVSPHDTFAYQWCSIAGRAKLYLGKEEEAIAWLRQSIETNRNYPISHFFLAAALAHLGRLSEARLEAETGLVLNRTFTITRFRASAPSDNPTAVAGLERLIDGLRKAGVPEG